MQLRSRKLSIRPPHTCFNPHPARRPGATSAVRELPLLQQTGFNPHPARRPGATSHRGNRRILLDDVSILTRPEGRVQPAIAATVASCLTMFQSSPGQKAGCNKEAQVSAMDARRAVSILTRPEGRVQPRALDGEAVMDNRVSILTRPEGRVQPAAPGSRLAERRVSILTRPEGRVQPPYRFPGCAA